MAAKDIQAKIRGGLRKAIAKTGSSSSLPVYVVKRTKTGGGNSPGNPPVYSMFEILLVDAIFQTYNADQVDGSLILSGDRRLVSNSDIPIVQNDKIKQGAQEYVVINTDPTSPASEPLVYKSQLRLN